MEEGLHLHQAIEEQFHLGEWELNILGCCLLEIGMSGVLGMWVADWRQ